MCGRLFEYELQGIVLIRFSLTGSCFCFGSFVLIGRGFWGWLKSVFACVYIFLCDEILELVMV